MSYNPNNPNGNATAANSAPVTLASDNNGPVKITDGTNISSVLKSDGTAAGQNALMVAGGRMELTGLSAAATNADLVVSTDVSNYREISVHILGSSYSGTLTLQGSNDNSTFTSIRGRDVNSGLNVGTTGSTNQIIIVPVKFRYFRFRMTAYTSGTATAVAEFYTQAAPQTALDAQQVSSWTVGSNTSTGSAVPSAAFYLGINNGGNLGGVSAASSAADGSGGGGAISVSQSIFNGTNYDRMRGAAGAVAAGTGTLAVAPVPSTVSLGLSSFQNTAVSTTVVAVKASAGRLHRVFIQNPNASVAFLQVFNTAQASVTLGTTTPLMSIPVPASGIFEDFFEFSDTFSTAISIAATTTAQGSTAVSTALFVSLGYI